MDNKIQELKRLLGDIYDSGKYDSVKDLIQQVEQEQKEKEKTKEEELRKQRVAQRDKYIKKIQNTGGTGRPYTSYDLNFAKNVLMIALDNQVPVECWTVEDMQETERVFDLFIDVFVETTKTEPDWEKLFATLKKLPLEFSLSKTTHADLDKATKAINKFLKWNNF